MVRICLVTRIQLSTRTSSPRTTIHMNGWVNQKKNRLDKAEMRMAQR